MLRKACRYLLPVCILGCLATAPTCRAADVPAARPYQAVVRDLETFIRRQMADKGLPALSIALVDGDEVVWAQGFGVADPENGKRATADTVYRVGSVSKLFTDLAVMRLVERGALDLDVPVNRYLPVFKPINPFDRAITLRQLMAHRSGLVREPPIGNYFDDTAPSLARTVGSLNRTELVYAPGRKTKYSNAGIATVGLVLEETQKERFAHYLARTLLNPLGMEHSSFEPDLALAGERARGVMWTYHGREFPAPTFEMGIAPAGSMYTSANDLARFLRFLFNRGQGLRGALVKAETLEQMWKPQYAEPGTGSAFGLGFLVEKFEGHRLVGHGGAVYGFATELAALPDDRLGVVVITSRDCANAVTRRVGEVALRSMLAVRDKKPLPSLRETTPLKSGRARQLAGRYRSGDKVLDLLEREGKLWLLPARGGFRVELRGLGDDLVVDDRLSYGQRLEVRGEKLRLDGDTYERTPVKKPEPVPAKWAGLLGAYGWHHNTLVILEKDGKLHALIEWFFLYPLKEEGADVFRFPSFGLYENEKLVFTRDRQGRASAVEAAGVVFPRRSLKGEGATFQIQPRQPVAELRRAALAARPPEEKGAFRKPDLMELTALDSTIQLDIRYAGTDNFLGTPVYQLAKAYLQRPAAEALVRAHRQLAAEGYGLRVFDGYRPWSVTKLFWDATPPELRVFVADPARGSRHNRGCAVDLTLYERKTGKPVEMVSGFDEMSDRAYPDYLGGTSLQRYHRDLLRRALEAEGFRVYEAEWWHFDYKDWEHYPILNVPFEKIE